jgi:cob(I)alamin adenosyltransferase
MRLYTRTGDQGEAGLIGGVRRPKNDPIFHLLGDLDELNAALGWCAAQAEAGRFVESLHRHQGMCLEAGSAAAGAVSRADIEAECAWMEAEIDALVEEAPELRRFILPGGGPGAASLHLARAICRRAERSLSAEPSLAAWLPWLNRLSDWLFAAARAAAHAHGYTEAEWSPRS